MDAVKVGNNCRKKNNRLKNIIIDLCFGILLFLSIGQLEAKGLVSIAAGFLSAVVFLTVLRGLLAACNPVIVKKGGFAAVSTAATQGFLLIIPFALLAFAAQYFFHWNAALAFSSAGIMTCGTATGMELVKLGGGRKASVIITSLAAAALSAGWTFIAVMIQQRGIFG